MRYYSPYLHSAQSWNQNRSSSDLCSPADRPLTAHIPESSLLSSLVPIFPDWWGKPFTETFTSLSLEIIPLLGLRTPSTDTRNGGPAFHRDGSLLSQGGKWFQDSHLLMSALKAKMSSACTFKSHIIGHSQHRTYTLYFQFPMIMIFSKEGANSVFITDQEVFPLCLVNAQLISSLGNKIPFGVRTVPSGKGFYMQEFSNMRKYYWIEWM